jgi:hypothetical protein
MTKAATRTDNGTATAVQDAPAAVTLDYLKQERTRLDEQKQQVLAQLNAIIGAMSWIENEIKRLGET